VLVVLEVVITLYQLVKVEVQLDLVILQQEVVLALTMEQQVVLEVLALVGQKTIQGLAQVTKTLTPSIYTQ
jgi:hypothetical protein